MKKIDTLGPTLQQVVTWLNERYERDGTAPTLLGIGPMSEVCLRAVLELARDRDFPVILVASRNQIDANELGGGYVRGWNQRSFIKDLRRLAKEIGFDGLLYPCRDHGGPWQRDEELKAKLPEAEAMAKGKESYRHDLEAGFSLLHLDPTKDPHVEGQAAMEVVSRRTLELLEYCEATREELDLPPVSYEIGTEETAGGLTGYQAFEDFIGDLVQKVESKGLPRPAFIVGQTGTLVKMDRNVGQFDAEAARILAAIARKYGIGFKEHNADHLPVGLLREHPALGITAANVAPEFGYAETKALLELADQEKRAGAFAPGLEPSDFISLIQRYALESGRWKKWLLPEEDDLTEADIIKSPEKVRQVTQVCGHYVFDQPEVAQAREQVYHSLKESGLVPDPERHVIDAVKAAMDKYIEAFGAAGLTSQVREKP